MYTKVSHKWATSEPQVSHKWATSESQVSHKWATSEPQVSHKWVTSEPQVTHSESHPKKTSTKIVLDFFDLDLSNSYRI